jgi:Zierdtviridae DNA polymerase
MKFVSLHHHSTFSYMDGYRSPAAHVERAAELGMSALALTEHGNVSSHVQLEKAAKAANVKPIFGLEAYTALGPKERRKFHLTILAMNAVGYQNLMRITSRSWAEGFYQWPTVSGEMLAEHNEGLIVLSGCSDSLLACSLLGGKSIEVQDASYERARTTAAKFKALFGDRFYLEAQLFPELERTKTINQAYENLGRGLGVPLVATADVHYPQPNDNEMQVILHAAGRGAGSVAAQEAGWEYNIRLTHPVSDKVAYDRALGTGLSRSAAAAACRATAEIASRCNVVLPKAERLRYPGEVAGRELIWEWLRRGWAYRVKHGNRRMAENKDEYVARLNYEMDLIVSKDFIDYFLMLSDIVRFAKNSGIPVGPARGSAAASLVCYLLRITEIDPLQYPLMMFERFIAPTRVDEPDVDLDFDDERRRELREYAIRKYGEDRVGNIANYTKYKGKSALKDVGRVFPKVPRAAVEMAASMVIERSGGDSRADAGLLDTVEMFPAVKEIFNKYKDLWKATRLEGDYRGMSVHAAGLVITNKPVAEVCALYTRTKTVEGKEVSTTVVSVDKKDAAYLGLMKADFLGLSTMGMIRIALGLAGLTLDDLYAIPMTDQETLDAFRRNDVVGVFQYEGRATRLVNREVQPDSFQELADINALSRPGPLFSGTTADYIDIKHGKKQVEKLNPVWDRITAHTRGLMIYQEQILFALGEIGGLPDVRVHEMRRIISQKLGEAQFNTSMVDWVNGAVELQGIDRKLAEHMWGRLVTSASYAFNLPHCVSYSMLAFWCMWLKIHHPVAFYTAVLRKADKDDWQRIIKDAIRHGVKIRGVDPSCSELTWSIQQFDEDLFEPSILAGWHQVHGIGGAKATAVMNYRDALRGREMTWEDLAAVKGIGPAIMNPIRSADTGDPFGLHRIERALSGVRKSIETEELPIPRPTHSSDDILDAPPDSRVVFMGMVKLKEYKDWIEDERARTGDDLEAIKARMKYPNLPTGCVLHCYDDGDEDVYVRVDRRVYPEFKQRLQTIVPDRDVILVVARKSRNSFGASIYVKQLWVIDPD